MLKAVALGCGPGWDAKAVAEDIASFRLVVLGKPYSCSTLSRMLCKERSEPPAPGCAWCFACVLGDAVELIMLAIMLKHGSEGWSHASFQFLLNVL